MNAVVVLPTYNECEKVRSLLAAVRAAQPDVDVIVIDDNSGELLRLIDAGADAVIGSRYVRGGATVGWPLHRRLLSRWGNRYTSLMLGVDVRDCTSGFHAYRAAALRAIAPQTTTADGFAS